MHKKIALAQMCSGIDPLPNAKTLDEHIEYAASKGAEILFTPEMTGLLDSNRGRAAKSISFEKDDIVLKSAIAGAKDNNIWIALGSLALKSEDSEKWLNRSFLIDPTGQIVARYDKIHLFDVDLETGESWKESAAYEGGKRAIVAPVSDVMLGLSICYDLRFPSLYAALTNAGAILLSIPAAFTVSTGKAHWQTLIRARAIEAGAFVVAAAQCGTHEDGRSTYGHSMVVDPWGKVLLDMESQLEVGICEIDMNAVPEVRSRVPSVANRRDFEIPQDTQ